MSDRNGTSDARNETVLEARGLTKIFGAGEAAIRAVDLALRANTKIRHRREVSSGCSPAKGPQQASCRSRAALPHRD